MAKREKKKSDEPPGAPGWVVTYGDMMTLLLTFFILLISFSTISEKKFSQAAASMKGALGVMPKNLSAVQILPSAQAARPAPKSIQRLARKLKERLQVTGKDQDIRLEYDKQGGLKIDLPSRVLFDLGRAELRAEALPVLNDLAQLLREAEGVFIEVRGHTDTLLLKDTSIYRDNYDLSYARAKSVMLHLNAIGGIPEQAFEVIACGPSQPAATNDTEEGRQANRRVELYVRGEPSEEVLDILREKVEALPGLGPASTAVEE